eukprot:GDKJ01012928.1.p2 GENE.GDKJ01012928.1~~GDKJ01012928.1.p2  ORF type:complete len:150 (-),score=37.41 GDKJ01012928.1:595-1044(-)
MPATAGRSKRKTDNRMHVEVSNEKGMWASKKTTQKNDDVNSSQNLNFAKIFGVSSKETPGRCESCGEIGHLTMSCRNSTNNVGLKKIDTLSTTFNNQKQNEEDWKFVEKLKKKLEKSARHSTRSSRHHRSESSDSEQGRYSQKRRKYED